MELSLRETALLVGTMLVLGFGLTGAATLAAILLARWRRRRQPPK